MFARKYSTNLANLPQRLKQFSKSKNKDLLIKANRNVI